MVGTLCSDADVRSTCCRCSCSMEGEWIYCYCYRYTFGEDGLLILAREWTRLYAKPSWYALVAMFCTLWWKFDRSVYWRYIIMGHSYMHFCQLTFPNIYLFEPAISSNWWITGFSFADIWTTSFTLFLRHHLFKHRFTDRNTPIVKSETVDLERSAVKQTAENTKRWPRVKSPQYWYRLCQSQLLSVLVEGCSWTVSISFTNYEITAIWDNRNPTTNLSKFTEPNLRTPSTRPYVFFKENWGSESLNIMRIWFSMFRLLLRNPKIQWKKADDNSPQISRLFV